MQLPAGAVAAKQIADVDEAQARSWRRWSSNLPPAAGLHGFILDKSSGACSCRRKLPPHIARAGVSGEAEGHVVLLGTGARSTDHKLLRAIMRHFTRHHKGNACARWAMADGKAGSPCWLYAILTA